MLFSGLTLPEAMAASVPLPRPQRPASNEPICTDGQPYPVPQGTLGFFGHEPGTVGTHFSQTRGLSKFLGASLALWQPRGRPRALELWAAWP